MNSSPSRRLAIDIARGLSVLGMMVEHLIPTEGAVTPLGHWVTTVSGWFTGRSASLFFVLAGISWAIQMVKESGSPRHWEYILRRSVCLVALGAILHATVWPTEVLMAIGVALPICCAIYQMGKRAVWISLGGVLVLVPLLFGYSQGLMAHDWTDAGEPILTLASLPRLAFLDGCYPLIPWLAFVLIGMLLSLYKPKPVGIAIVGGIVASITGGVEAWLHLDPKSFWATEWVPTTYPFLLICGGVACTVIGILEWADIKLSRFQLAQRLGAIGQTSLSHYLGHILILVLPLRHWYPAEEWPSRIGLLAYFGYFLFAILLTPLWLKRFRRGPVESLMSGFTGADRRVHASK